MRQETRRSYSKEQVLGFVGGFVPFLISLLTTVFLTMINFYYCYAISIGALLCFLLFSFGAIQHNRSTHVLIMMVYTAFFELVLIVFNGMFIYYCFEPQKGPFCKLCEQHTEYKISESTTPSFGPTSRSRTTTLSLKDKITLECEGPCESGVESVVVVCVFSLCFAVNFFCLIRMWQFRYYLRGLERRAAQRARPSNNVWATGDDIFDFPENGPPPYYNASETGDPAVQASETMHIDLAKQFYGKTALSVYCAPLPSYSEVSESESGTSAPPVYEEAIRQTVDSGSSDGLQESSFSNSTAS